MFFFFRPFQSMGHAYLGPMAWIIPFFVAVSVFGAFIGASLISSRFVNSDVKKKKLFVNTITPSEE